MRGKLFTQDYLGHPEGGITETSAWRDLGDDQVAAVRDRLTDVFRAFPVIGTPHEATTEQDLILPVLEALGWEHYLPQQTTSARGRLDVPDVLLFADEEAKRAAQAEDRAQDRFLHGTAVVESKRWGRVLDRAEPKRVSKAALDALFFHLYGLSKSDAAYVLDQFPIVRREDEAAHGRYLTRDLILAYMNAVAAGGLETPVTA